MTRTDRSAAALDASPASDPRRRLLRTAGFGGIGAAVAWFLQPVLVSIASADLVDGVDFAFVSSHPFNGIAEAAIFVAVGVGLLYFVTAVGRLARLSDAPTSTTAAVSQTLGVTAALGWILVAGLSVAPYTSVGLFLGEVAPDRATQLGLYQLLSVVLASAIMIYVVGFAWWLVALATIGRRRGVVGVPLAIVAFLAAAAMVAQLLVPFAPPWGTLAGLGFALTAGIAFLVKAKRAA
ncbi:hypothetical protein ASE14_12960 [Agromyces sp. Root81]|uniref:hypothetical protein n=1 Tax=Agromyces sp. Root81 TaxID=1736601 RepID=UPI0006F29499|nr:hypothetical protein [Agromyces sp. Root81]KRC61731.1 hypothetical protein ASE14_12960 [Agromyces sp. Root81]